MTMQTEDERQAHEQEGSRQQGSEQQPAATAAPPVRRTIDPSEPWSEERMRDAAPAEMLRDRPAEDAEHADG